MKWDFSKVKVVLIPSLAGKHEGWPKVRYFLASRFQLTQRFSGGTNRSYCAHDRNSRLGTANFTGQRTHFGVPGALGVGIVIVQQA